VQFPPAAVKLLLLQGARRLRPIELHAADPQHRQDCHPENDQTHSSEPLQLLAIEKDGFRQLIQTSNHGGTRGRDSRDGLEQGVYRRKLRVERQGPGTQEAEQ
jgi:hypothetical protein